MAEWVRYEVAIHYHGRRLCRRGGPCEGLLNWPEHKWGTVSTRPLGLKAAIALADAQPMHATVTRMSAEKVYDNGKAPAVPDGWWPAEAQVASDPRGPVTA